MAKGSKTGGREFGTPNKVTNEIKQSFQLIIEKNIDNFDTWLNDIAKENPAKAFDIILKLSEFVVPKINKQSINIVENMPYPVVAITGMVVK